MPTGRGHGARTRAEHEQLADVNAGRLSKVEGVRRTDTHIAFRSWSRADTEATFSVGLES